MSMIINAKQAKQNKLLPSEYSKVMFMILPLEAANRTEIHVTLRSEGSSTPEVS